MDEITGCKLYREPDASIRYYEVTFSYDGLTVPSGWNPVFVYPGQMKDPNDLSEVRTQAMAQASVTKALFASAEIITSINGPVNI